MLSVDPRPATVEQGLPIDIVIILVVTVTGRWLQPKSMQFKLDYALI